jgi:hypothetical protein
MGMFERIKAKDRTEVEKKMKKKKKKGEKSVRGGERNRKNGRRRRKIYFQKLVYMNLVQTVHPQNFQTPLQLPENIGFFYRKINARHHYIVSIDIKFKLTCVYSLSQPKCLKYNAKSDL